MNRKTVALILISFMSCTAGFGDTPSSTQDLQNIVNFLIGDSQQVGVAYQGTSRGLSGNLLPLSYYSTPDYWGKYVCQISGNNCQVSDSYNSGNYTLTPALNSPGAQLQVERINVFNGTDIYDAACWQIALAIAAVNNIKSPNQQSLFDIANNQNTLLKQGYDGNADCSIACNAWDNRAYTQANLYTYHGISISQTQAQNAYFYRMIPKKWLSNDPFLNTSYLKQYVSVDKSLPSNYQIGNVTWMDWKPITGENAWAFFIGPIQTAYLQFIRSQKQAYVPFDNVAIQNALNIVPAFRAMQSPIGAIYYAVPGSLGNTGGDPVDPYEVSVENNASTLAGLLMYSQVLLQELHHEKDLSSANKTAVVNTINEIYTMIYGGNMPANSEFVYTNGLLSFFKNYAWDAKDKEFLQGGLANKPNQAIWQPTAEPKAVDVNTWGMTVLGQPLIDQWFGDNTAYTTWQSIKSWGGFTGPDGKLWGVGYSDQYNNSSLPQPVCESGSYNGQNSIISAEWTAGAINMAKVLSAQYKHSGNGQSSSSLDNDADSMATGLLSLRSDKYPTSDAYSSARPDNYSNLIAIPNDKLSYVYASRRCFIPFGWMANPLPSTTSSAWAVMVNEHFNPFTLGGSTEPNRFYWGNLTTPVTVTVINNVKDATKIAVNYKLGSNDQWTYGPQITKSQAVTLQQNISVLQISYTKDGQNWYAACTINNPQKLLAYADTFGNSANHIAIQGNWTNNQGEGECQVVGTN